MFVIISGKAAEWQQSNNSQDEEKLSPKLEVCFLMSWDGCCPLCATFQTLTAVLLFLYYLQKYKSLQIFCLTTWSAGLRTNVSCPAATPGSRQTGPVLPGWFPGKCLSLTQSLQVWHLLLKLCSRLLAVFTAGCTYLAPLVVAVAHYVTQMRPLWVWVDRLPGQMHI